MESFELVREETRRFAENSYVEVSRKRLVVNGAPTEFIVITRGFFASDGTKRWTRFVILPDAADVKAWVAAAIPRV